MFIIVINLRSPSVTVTGLPNMCPIIKNKDMWVNAFGKIPKFYAIITNALASACVFTQVAKASIVLIKSKNILVKLSAQHSKFLKKKKCASVQIHCK